MHGEHEGQHRAQGRTLGYSEGEEVLTRLPAEAGAALDGQVTSCAITAWRPA